MAKRTWERVALAALMLGSCESRLRPSVHSADEAYDLASAAQTNARRALGRIDELSSRIDPTGDVEDVNRLQSQVRDLEARLRTAESNIDNIITTYNRNIRAGR